MEDIAPKLLDEIKTDFDKRTAKNKYISKYLNNLKDGKATFEDTQRYSKELGKELGESLSSVLKFDNLPDEKLYWNIAERTVKPMYNDVHDAVNLSAEATQKIIDLEQGIGLNAIKPELEAERVKGILEAITKEGLKDDELSAMLKMFTENLTEHFFDKFIEENAEFRESAGLQPIVTRSTKGNEPCEWCIEKAGTYSYKEAKKNDVFRRHTDCHCVITYETNGKKETLAQMMTYKEKKAREEKAIKEREEKRALRAEANKKLAKERSKAKYARMKQLEENAKQ